MFKKRSCKEIKDISIAMTWISNKKKDNYTTETLELHLGVEKLQITSIISNGKTPPMILISWPSDTQHFHARAEYTQPRSAGITIINNPARSGNNCTVIFATKIALSATKDADRRSGPARDNYLQSRPISAIYFGQLTSDIGIGCVLHGEWDLAPGRAWRCLENNRCLGPRLTSAMICSSCDGRGT